jgi:drug/metabolite transporter (DMT)-like permease
MFGLVFFLKLQLPKGTQWFHLWVAGVLMSAIPFALFSFAQQSTTSSLAAIIGATTPIFTLLAILTIYRTEKVTIIATIGLAVGLIGVAITLGIWEGFGQNDPLAIGALVLATISYGIGGPYIRKYVTPMNLSGTSSAAAQVSTSALTLLPFYLFTGPLFTSSPSMESLLAILALGVLGSGFAYRLFHDVVKAAGSTVALTVTFTNPVLATIWGILLLGEELHWYEPIGGAVVILGAWLAQNKSSK